MGKKIAIVFSGDFPEGNTKNARLKIIANQLYDSDWKTTFCSVYPYRFSKDISRKQPNIWNNFRVLYFSIGRKYPSLMLFRVIQMAFAQITILWWSFFLAGKYDAIYYYNPRWTDALLSLCINSMLGRKTVVDQTELFSSGVNDKWHKTEERIIAKQASLLFLISKKLHSHYKKMRSHNIYQFPIMVDIKRFSLEAKEIPFTMGYIGSFASKDGVDLLLQAVKKVSETLPQIKLRLVGHNPNPKILQNDLRVLNLQNIVEITGTVSYKEVSRLLLECDTLLMNRDHSNFASYGYPIKLGEYFACKKPVLMSNGEGFSQDFEHCNQVYKYDVDSVESLVDVILYRYNHMSESNALAKRGYQYAIDHFDYTKRSLFLANMLNKL